MTRLPIALSFSLQCRRGWISSTAVKVCLTKRSRDSWPHGLQADLVSGLPRRPSTISLLYFPEIGRVVPEYSLPTMKSQSDPIALFIVSITHGNLSKLPEYGTQQEAPLNWDDCVKAISRQVDTARSPSSPD